MDPVKTGKLIAAMRKRQHLTQEALGEKLGVTNKTVSRWETGAYMPDIDKLLDLSAALGVSVNELLCGERIQEPAELLKKADENLVLALLSQESPFSPRERLDYFKRKWLRDHRSCIVFLCLVYAAALFGAVISGKAVLYGSCPVLALGLYLLVYNRMMAYAERNAFK